jgi:hypothetical protein
VKKLRFEEALAIDLESIPAFADKVFPLVVAADKTAPYIAYASNEGLKLKTLTGYIESKSISVEVNIVAKNYTELKQLTSLVMDKLISFENSSIGDGSLLIQEVYFQPPLEAYDNESDLYRSTLTFQVYL